MKKKFLMIIGIIILIICGYFSLFFIQNLQIQKSLEEFNKKKLDNERALVRCNYNIFKPKFAYVYFDEDISFDSLNKMFWNASDWENSYTGGTTIKNTTFPELLKLVKKDCDRFQKSSSLNADPNDTRWVYSKAEPPKTPEQIAEQKKKDRDYLYEFYIQDLSKYNKKEIEILVKIFGDWREMPKEEFIDFMEAQKNKQLTPKEQKEVDLIRKARKKRGAEQEARDLK